LDHVGDTGFVLVFNLHHLGEQCDCIRCIAKIEAERNGIGAGSNASYSFLLAISGLHGLHVLGGVIALVVIAIQALRVSTRNYNTVPLEVAATYWHFVDALWIYLFIFFNWMK